MICLYNELSFQILSVGRYEHIPGHYRVEGRPHAALGYRTGGEAAFELGGQSFVSHPGDVLYIPAYMDYRVDYTVGESLVVHMTDCNYTRPENLSFHADAFLSDAFLSIYTHWKNTADPRRAKAQVYTLLADMGELSTPTSDARVWECVGYIDKHLFDPTLCLANICHALCLSESTLRRTFYRHFGLSPIRYIRDKRLSAAVAMLTEKKLSVKEIAFAVGFTDEKYFSRCIKEKYRVSPSVLGKSFC